MNGERLTELADQLENGSINLADIDAAKEMQIILLRQAAKVDEFTKQIFEQRKSALDLHTNDKIQNILTVLSSRPELIDPMYNFLNSLLSEQQKRNKIKELTDVGTAGSGIIPTPIG